LVPHRSQTLVPAIGWFAEFARGLLFGRVLGMVGRRVIALKKLTSIYREAVSGA
jgi:hypothetical protein